MLARDFGVFNLTQDYTHEYHGYNLEFINGFLSEKILVKLWIILN